MIRVISTHGIKDNKDNNKDNKDLRDNKDNPNTKQSTANNSTSHSGIKKT